MFPHCHEIHVQRVFILALRCWIFSPWADFKYHLSIQLPELFNIKCGLQAGVCQRQTIPLRLWGRDPSWKCSPKRSNLVYPLLTCTKLPRWRKMVVWDVWNLVMGLRSIGVNSPFSYHDCRHKPHLTKGVYDPSHELLLSVCLCV